MFLGGACCGGQGRRRGRTVFSTNSSPALRAGGRSARTGPRVLSPWSCTTETEGFLSTGGNKRPSGRSWSVRALTSRLIFLVGGKWSCLRIAQPPPAGPTTWENCVACCMKCNCRKAAKLLKVGARAQTLNHQPTNPASRPASDTLKSRAFSTPPALFFALAAVEQLWNI